LDVAAEAGDRDAADRGEREESSRDVFELGVQSGARPVSALG